ncbi:MAG: hypothetical protein WCK51_15170 [Armatimonadota bacterium]
MTRWIVSLTTLLAVAVASAEQTVNPVLLPSFSPPSEPTLNPSTLAILIIGVAGLHRLKQSNEI